MLLMLDIILSINQILYDIVYCSVYNHPQNVFMEESWVVHNVLLRCRSYSPAESSDDSTDSSVEHSSRHYKKEKPR